MKAGSVVKGGAVACSGETCRQSPRACGRRQFTSVHHLPCRAVGLWGLPHKHTPKDVVHGGDPVHERREIKKQVAF